MKLAQLAYETFSQSFGIDTEQLVDRRRSVVGPIPWGSLPSGEQRRWAIVAARIKRELVNEIATTYANAKKSIIAAHPDRPVQCRCGARFMAGESHMCNDDPRLIAKLTGAESRG